MRPRLPSVALALSLALALPSAALAQETRPAAPREKGPFDTKPGYVQLMATTFVGDGLRFNNPFRLATPLGSSAESVSRTAAYTDLGIAATFGDPLALQHGLALRGSLAMEGVPQLVMTPSYLAWRRWRAWAVYGRFGLPIALSPEPTWGFELGGGAAWFARAGIGIAGELVSDLFYGAGTREVAHPSYPVLSAQLGLLVAWEVLP
jgi:hypothetical protein